MIALVEYDANWPTLFRRESGSVMLAAGGLLSSVEHIGSTAVIGLSAKPVIDIVGAVDNLRQVDSVIDPLTNLGYEYFGEYGLPERYFFVKKVGGGGFHLHIVRQHSSYWRRFLAFRDALQSSSVLRNEYSLLKHRLAAKHAADPDAYSRAKSDFIERIIESDR